MIAVRAFLAGGANMGMGWWVVVVAGFVAVQLFVEGCYGCNFFYAIFHIVGCIADSRADLEKLIRIVCQLLGELAAVRADEVAEGGHHLHVLGQGVGFLQGSDVCD